MTKIFVSFFAAALLLSCGNNANKTATTDAPSTPAGPTKPAATAMTADQEKGLDLITKSDCLGCHKVGEKLVGPAYLDVAKRYAGKPGIEDSLAGKIIRGGSGNWGSVPMQGHPQLSEADAKAMVAYILSTPNQ